VSTSQVFVTGQTATGHYNLSNLASGTSVGNRYDGLTGNVRTGQAYVLASQDFIPPFNINPITTAQSSVGVTLTHVIPVDATTGALGSPVALTSSIFVGPATGIYAGYDRVVVHPNNGSVYEIDLTAGLQGQVNILSALVVTPTHQTAASWAFWGTTEHF